jgi:hypothetical protein
MCTLLLLVVQEACGRDSWWLVCDLCLELVLCKHAFCCMCHVHVHGLNVIQLNRCITSAMDHGIRQDELWGKAVVFVA